MQEKIHPRYTEANIECACGNVIKTRSTRGSFKIDICSACHPFFTGKQKLIDAAGRVERFRRKYGRKGPEDAAAAGAAATPAAPAAAPAPKGEGEA